MNNSFFLSASVGIIGALLVAYGKRPLAKLQKGVILLRASGFFAVELVEGAKSRIPRWRECVSRAQREL